MKYCTYILYSIFLLFLLSECTSSSNQSLPHKDANEDIQRGKILAEKHCQSCHLFPEPSLLDKETWVTGVLPAMGPLLGVFRYQNQTYQYRGDPQMRGPGFLSSNPILNEEEWSHIVNYYEFFAPDQLPKQERSDKINMNLPLFKISKKISNQKNAHTSFVKIRANKQHSVVYSDAVSQKTYFLNHQLSVLDSIQTNGPLVHIEFIDDNKAIFTDIGMIQPHSGSLGGAGHFFLGNQNWQIGLPLFKGLRRPVQITPADVNNDFEQDLIVCEFGYMQGGLSWLNNIGDNVYEKKEISPLPGAIKAIITDYNQDGWQDIIALFAQGIEGIYVFINQGDGTFKEKKLLTFPSVWGSSYFELADFNGDGKEDILYAAGDNADYSTVLKPYHGIYIYLNQGEDHFEQAYFYPIHGCYKAMANDFDLDGDLDIATIAHYADFGNQAEEGFVYLENLGDFKFSAQSEKELEVGRWITMDIGDIEIDGDQDIILGNFVQPSKFSNSNINWANGPPILILENLIK